MMIRFLAKVVPFAVLPYLGTDAAAQVTPYGSGVNPPGSLVLVSGIPLVGESFTVGVSNSATNSAPPALAFLSLASMPDAAFPAGTVLPGLGLGAPGAPGELLLSFGAPNPLVTLGPVPWAGGATPPAHFPLAVPLLPSLVGISIYLQGALLDLSAAPSFGLSNGLEVTLAAPSFPGLVLIQPGTFAMGSNAAPQVPYLGNPNHQPVHEVTIARPFWMGRYEVTQAEYQALMGTNPSYHVGLNRPVDRVNWFDAVAYCSALHAQEDALGRVPPGYEYRLPTEAEWEYACRADTTTEFHYGPALLCNQAQFGYSQHEEHLCPGWQSSGTAPVGSYAPNAWGLYDMHGNVWEWCLDGYDLYTGTPKTDPFVTGSPFRVYRGGSHNSSSNTCRSAYRWFSFPGEVLISRGFRVVLAPKVAG